MDTFLEYTKSSEMVFKEHFQQATSVAVQQIKLKVFI